MATATVRLKKPIEFAGERIEQLTFRPIKAKDLKRLQAPPERPIAMTLELASYLSGQPEPVIDELEGEDLQEVLKVVSDFFGAGPKTGGAP